MRSQTPLCALLVALFAVLLIAGCAAPTRLNAQWLDPQFAGKPPLSKVLVVGIAPDGTTRRVFEDLLAESLSARGVAAVQSYRFLPDDAPPTQPQIEDAIRSAGAQAVLTTRIVSVTQSVRVSPGAQMGPAWGGAWGWGGPWGWGGYYNGLWGSAFNAPQVWTEENVVADTRLLDVAGRTVVWSGSTTTSAAPGQLGTAQILQQFAQLIAEALATAKLI